MRFFAVLIALVAVTFSARVHAQADAPPAPLDEPAPDAPSVAPPVAPSVEAAPLAREAPPPADAPAPAAPAPDPAQANGCGSWPLAVSGAMFEGGALGVGGLMFCIGGALASVQPTSSSGDCAQACVDILVAIAVIAIGLVLVAGGLVVLGPVASIAVTVAMSLAAIGAGRAWWPAAVGGTLGVLSAFAGIGLVVWGFTNAQTLPFVGGGALTLSDAPHLALVSGLVLAGAAGLVSLGAGLALDAAFGGAAPEAAREDDEGAPPARSARASPASKPRASAPIARHAMAY